MYKINNSSIELVEEDITELSVDAIVNPAGLPLFYVPVVMRVFHAYYPCLEEGGA